MCDLMDMGSPHWFILKEAVPPHYYVGLVTDSLVHSGNFPSCVHRVGESSRSVSSHTSAAQVKCNWDSPA